MDPRLARELFEIETRGHLNSIGVPERFTNRLSKLAGFMLNTLGWFYKGSETNDIFVPTDPFSGMGYVIQLEENPHVVTASDGGIPPGGAYGGTNDSL